MHESLRRPLALDHAPELSAHLGHQRDELRVGLEQLLGEELEHADDLAADQHGEADRGAQARGGRRSDARQ